MALQAKNMKNELCRLAGSHLINLKSRISGALEVEVIGSDLCDHLGRKHLPNRIYSNIIADTQECTVINLKKQHPLD